MRARGVVTWGFVALCGVWNISSSMVRSDKPKYSMKSLERVLLSGK
nr:hypothetical protein GZ35D7_9 [uncultured archaeon GZfos35D7]